MAVSTSSCLKELEKVKAEFGEGPARAKLEMIDRLGRRSLGNADDLLRFHEVLCFLRAYPDNGELLLCVEVLLDSFADRKDLRRFRKGLAESGIAGTTTSYPFFWFTAHWLARKWPSQLAIEWKDFDRSSRLEKILHLLVPFCETPGLDEVSLTPREWIEAMKKPDESDAAFLIGRFAALHATSFGRETIYEDLDMPIRLDPGRSSPSRTAARYEGVPVRFQKTPLSRGRPSLKKEAMIPPESVRPVAVGEARKLIDLARGAMVTRSRDLDVFVHADENDVRLVDCGGGLQFACMGAIPERRLMLEAVYGFLTLRNGAPTGYLLASALFGSAGLAYNIFDTFRGAESASVFGRILGMSRHLFGVDVFMMDPYQLGHDNDEGLKSGAWWFYYKLGFRSHDPGVRALVREEFERVKRNPRHRSTRATLQKLTAEPMFLYLNGPRRDVLGRVSLGNIGLRITRYLAARFGKDREKGIRTCAREAAQLLGARMTGKISRGEKLAWERWGPLVMALPGVRRWSAANRRALTRVIRAKGGRRESDFVTLFDGHPLLRRAVLKMTEEE